MAHILGAMMMRANCMSKGEFNKWLEDNYKEPEEREIIIRQITEQVKEQKYSYGKVY